MSKTENAMVDNESLRAALTQDVYAACKGSPEYRDIPGDLCPLRAHASVLCHPRRPVISLRTFCPHLPPRETFSVNIVARFYEEQAA